MKRKDLFVYTHNPSVIYGLRAVQEYLKNNFNILYPSNKVWDKHQKMIKDFLGPKKWFVNQFKNGNELRDIDQPMMYHYLIDGLFTTEKINDVCKEKTPLDFIDFSSVKLFLKIADELADGQSGTHREFKGIINDCKRHLMKQFPELHTL